MDNIIRVAFAYICFVYLNSYSNSIDRFADVRTASLKSYVISKYSLIKSNQQSIHCETAAIDTIHSW